MELDVIAQGLGDTEDVRRVMAQHQHSHEQDDCLARLRQRSAELEQQIIASEAKLAPYYGSMRVTPERIADAVEAWFKGNGEWPHPWQMHRLIADWSGCPVEVGQYDTLMALEGGEVYGLPSVVAMRIGEAAGDWRAPLPREDNGFRLAVLTESFG